jgi:hypothetical protein
MSSSGGGAKFQAGEKPSEHALQNQQATKKAKNAKKSPNFTPKTEKTAVCNCHVNFLTLQRSPGCAFIPIGSANEENVFALAYFAFDLFRKLPKVTDELPAEVPDSPLGLIPVLRKPQ